jgi:hypothetical protein
MRRLLLYLASALPDAVALLIGGFLRLMWGRRMARKWGVLWVELSDAPGFRGWFARGPYKEWGGTTFGHVILIQAGHLAWADATDEQIRMVEGQDPHKFVVTPDLYDVALTLSLAQHELQHTEQFEAEAVQNLVLNVLAVLVGTLTGAVLWPYTLVWWALGGLTAIGAGNITAFLRGEDAYLGSHFEEAARMRVTCRNNPKLAASARLAS